jgi:hypothetical protein
MFYRTYAIIREKRLEPYHRQTTILKVLPYLYDVGYGQRIETETTIRQTGRPIPILSAS